jgi:hypothetical protein
MPPVTEKDIRLLGQLVNAVPRDFFLSVQILLYFEDLGTVRLHDRVTTHAKRYTRNTCDAIFL